MHKIVFIPGDGIGPEVSESAKKCIEATGVEIDWQYAEAGDKAIEKYNTPLPEKTIDIIKEIGIALKGPITTPIGKGFRSVNVALRKKLELYSCLRPCKTYPGTRSKYDNIDLVIVRENTEDLYAGIEFEQGKEQTQEFIKHIESISTSQIRSNSGISIKPTSILSTEKIVRFAFNYAIENNRQKVTAVHKANIMKFTDGLFLNVARRVAEEFKDSGIEFEDVLVDNMCMQLVQVPEKYDVLVMPNLYGDIVSDLCAGLVGGLGMAPGANIGKDCAVFEATHGSAPKYTGQNKVNPTSMILSGVLMLRYIGEKEAADRLEKAVAAVISDGKNITYDLTPERTGENAVGTSQMADAIIEKITSL